MGPCGDSATGSPIFAPHEGERALVGPRLEDPSQPAKSLNSKHVTVRPACHSYQSQEPLAAGCKQCVLLARRPTGAGNLCSAYPGGALADSGGAVPVLAA